MNSANSVQRKGYTPSG